MCAYPLFPKRRTVDLAGVWDFVFLPESLVKLIDFSPEQIEYSEFMPLPGCFDVTPDYAGKRGLGVYRRTFSVSGDGIARLHVGGATVSAKFFCDGKLIALDDLPYSGVTYDFPVSAGEHELVAAVENRIDPDFNPLFYAGYDFYAFGGILRSISVEELPDFPLGRCRVTTLDWQTGRVRLAVDLPETPAEKIELQIAFDGEPAKLESFTVRNGVAVCECTVPNPAPWSPESPCLHIVKIEKMDASDAVVERFGIREIRCEKQHILLNGKPLCLLGYNRHESHPEFGANLPLAISIEDLQLLRKLHCNFIRGCHYPQSQDFLDLCDDMGFLVWEESLAWGNGKECLENERFVSKQIEQTRLMVRNSFNHPSVILWGFLNETHSFEPSARTVIGKLTETIRAEDRSRPITFASMSIGYGEQCLDLVDVISCNTYPGWYGNQTDEAPDSMLTKIGTRFDDVERLIDTPKLRDKPLIISEIGAAALYGCRDRMAIPWTEEFQSDYVAEVCRQIAARPRICGLALWHFADARTFKVNASLNRARGFNNKGSFDEYRRPKAVCRTVADAFSAMRKKLD